MAFFAANPRMSLLKPFNHHARTTAPIHPLQPLLPSHRRPRRKWEAVLLGLLISFTAFCSRPAQAQLSVQDSPKVQRQLEAIRQDKESRTPAQKKIHTSLLYAAREATVGVALRSVPSLRSNVTQEADGRVKVKITAAVTPELLGVIKTQGGTVLASFPAYRAVYARLPLAQPGNRRGPLRGGVHRHPAETYL